MTERQIHTITCDGCGADLLAPSDCGLRVTLDTEVRDIKPRTIIDQGAWRVPTERMHFCDLLCLGRWADEHDYVRYQPAADLIGN